MSLTFNPGPLDDASKRAVIREAESVLQPGQDAKAELVKAALDNHAVELGGRIGAALAQAIQTAEIMGDPITADTLAEAVPEVVQQIGATQFAEALGEIEHVAANLEAVSYALAKACQAMFKGPLPMHRGKFLSKLGIVAGDIAAIGGSDAGATEPAPPEPVVEALPETPMSPEMAALLGLDAPSAPEVPAPPFVPAVPAAAPQDTASGAVPTAALPYSPPPPNDLDAVGALVLFAKALKLNDEELARRIGKSRGTLSNWFNAKSQKINMTPEMARMFAIECDVRLGQLRQAADFFHHLAHQ